MPRHCPHLGLICVAWSLPSLKMCTSAGEFRPEPDLVMIKGTPQHQKGLKYSNQDLPAAHNLLDGSCDKNKLNYDAAITECSRAGEWQLAVGLLQRMSDCGHLPTSHSYNGAASSYARSGRWRDTLRLLNEMRHRGVEWDPFSFTIAINAFGKSGRWRQSVSPACSSRNCSPDDMDLGCSCADDPRLSSSAGSARQNEGSGL